MRVEEWMRRNVVTVQPDDSFLQLRGKGPLDIAAGIVALEEETRAP